jgi:hypothetical protein
VDAADSRVGPAGVDALKKVHLDTPPVNNWTPQKSLDDMDQGGVSTAIVSTTPPVVGFLGAKDAATVARASNEWTRKVADRSQRSLRHVCHAADAAS